MDNFGKACDDNKACIAFAAVIDPNQTDPMVFIRGHTYDVAKLLAMILRSMKNDLLSELEN